MDLAAIRSFFCNVPVLALTATAPPKTISLIQESLAMVSCKVIKVYPDRRNIYLTKHYRLDSCQRKQLMVYFGFNNIPVQDKCCCICDGSFGNETSCIGKKPAFPKGKVRTVTPENLSKLSSELFGYISTTNAINALEDEDCLFGQTPHVSENTVKDILTHAELISTEDDLLTELGIWDQTHSSAIFPLILKYSSVN